MGIIIQTVPVWGTASVVRALYGLPAGKLRERPEAGLCAVCASGEPEAAPLKWGGADLVQDELFGVAQ